MNILTVAIGAFMLCYGLHVLTTRARTEASRVRLKLFTRALGNKPGLVLFSLIYIILPVIVGGLLIAQGLDGVSMGELLGPQSP